MPSLVYALLEVRKVDRQKVREGMLAAAAVGYLCKHHATLAAAEGGCQAEIGVASSMAAALVATAFDAPSWTPAGEDTYGRYMRIRVMDQWFHEQDVREAIGRPGHLSGLAPEVVLDELSSAMGYVVGKQANFPEGSSVRIDLRGPMSHRWDIAVTDRARVVDQLSGEPTVTVTMPGATFCRLAGGRREWNHPWVRSAVVVEGDHDLGDQLLANLAFLP